MSKKRVQPQQATERAALDVTIHLTNEGSLYYDGFWSICNDNGDFVMHISRESAESILRDDAQWAIKKAMGEPHCPDYKDIERKMKVCTTSPRFACTRCDG